MNRSNLTNFLIFLLVLSMSSCSNSSNPKSDTTENTVEVILVRHAEKVDSSNDPDLSAEGYERADALAEYLQDKKFDFVHSSDFLRTRYTAKPICEKQGLTVQVYDHDDLPALVSKIHKLGGKHLVVGHSNTTPEMVKLLGGEPESDISEDEYDRLYSVEVRSDGSVNSSLVKYGSKSGGKTGSIMNHETSIDSETLLLGSVDRNGFKLSEYADWFDKTYNEYNPKKETLSQLETSLEDVEIKIFLGTWCSDSQRDVPAVYRILDDISYNKNDLQLIAIDRSKQLPKDQLEGYDIESVPTIILSRNNQELGRIVEAPEKTLEEDMLEISRN